MPGTESFQDQNWCETKKSLDQKILGPKHSRIEMYTGSNNSLEQNVRNKTSPAELQGGPKRSALYILLLSSAISMLAKLGTSLISHFKALNNVN